MAEAQPAPHREALMVTQAQHNALEERLTKLEAIIAGDADPETLAGKFSILRCIVAGNPDPTLRVKGARLLNELESGVRPLGLRLDRSATTTNT